MSSCQPLVTHRNSHWRRPPVPSPAPSGRVLPDSDPEPAKVVGTIRRSLPRHDVELAIDFTIAGQSHQSTTRMLSLGGAFIASDLRPLFDSRLELRFAVPTPSTLVEVGGVVRWSDERGFGVQFGGLRAHAVWALGKYFQLLRQASLKD